jgi:serine/threonine protein kinase
MTDKDDYKELIGYRVGDYVIDTFIAAGGQAAVYTAHLPQFQRTYALKIFGLTQSDPTALNVGLNEAKKLAAVDHPAVVTFYAPNVDEVQFEGNTCRVLYLPMDYALLGSCVKNPPFKDRYLSVLDFRSMIELLDGLQDIHDNGIIHEDIKPANILQFQKKINDEERIVLRITDFGIAKVQSALGVDPADPSGMSPEFMSPEQPDHIHNEKGDIYSMGATLFYMITEKLPIQSPGVNFPDPSSLIRAWQEAHKTQPRPNAMKSIYCPPRLALLIMRMMSVNPNDRPDLEECKKELRRIIDTHEQKLFRRLKMPTKLEAELDRDVFPIRYVPEDFQGIFKPKVHEICGTELFIIRINMGHPVYSQYKEIIEYMISRLSDCFCLYETWGTYDINILLWGKYDDKEARNLKKDLEQKLAGSKIQIRTAIKVHDFHCDNPNIPENLDPVYALAIQENKNLPDLQPDEYLCKGFHENVPADGIQAFTYVAPVESTTDPFIRKAIVRNVHEILAELMEQDKSSPGAARFRRMSMIELLPPDPSLSGHDATVLIVSFVANQYEYLAKVPTEIIEKIGANAVATSSFLATGRIVVQSDKILF